MATDNAVTAVKFWELKKYAEHEWFAALVKLLIFIVIMYLGAHYLIDKELKWNQDYEYSTLDAKQTQQINRIYFDSSSDVTLQLTDRHKKALSFVASEFGYKILPAQIDSTRDYLRSSSRLDAVAYLSSKRFQVKSNFWLIGPSIYWEIVFWSWFGVISSLLFSLGLVSSNATTDPNNRQTVFDSTEIPNQVAKLLYAPLCTLVIVFGYNFFSDGNIVDISSSKGVIVFAFIGGFYSSRLIAFLDRLKEVVLPMNNSAVMQRPANSQAPVIENLAVQLELDASITGDTRNEIAEVGLNSASVQFENGETGEVVKAEPPGEDQSSVFVIPKIKPGKYIAKVSWSKELEGEVVNLAAKQEVEIKNADDVLKVMVSRSEGSG